MPRVTLIALIALAVLVLAALGALVFMGNVKRSEPTFLVHGTVVDLATGSPISGARVEDDGYAGPPYRGGTADETGFYRYFTWAEEHNIVVRAPGYETKRALITGESFGPEQGQRVDFVLEKE